jgi:hypothetical protein
MRPQVAPAWAQVRLVQVDGMQLCEQQSVAALQFVPVPLQDVHTPPLHSPEQQMLLLVQVPLPPLRHMLQVPSTQVKPWQQGVSALHAWPGLPQFGHLPLLGHAPTQHGCVALHPWFGAKHATHWASPHALPEVHALPHLPQLASSVVTS